MGKFIFVGFLALTFASSCAASNGGGHGVGNSMMPPGTAKKVAEEKQLKDSKKLDDKLCDCTVKNPPKSCDCSKGKEAPAATPAPAAPTGSKKY